MKQIQGVLIQNERNRIERTQKLCSADGTGVCVAWMTLFPPPPVHLLPYPTLCVTSFVFSNHASERQIRPTDVPGRASTKQKAISFDIKKEVIAWKEKEEGNTAIGRDLGLSESSVRTVGCSLKKVAPSFIQDIIDSEAQDLRDSVARAVEVAREVPGFEFVTEDEVLVINSEGDTQSVADLVIEDDLVQAQEHPCKIKVRKTLFNVF